MKAVTSNVVSILILLAVFSLGVWSVEVSSANPSLSDVVDILVIVVTIVAAMLLGPKLQAYYNIFRIK